ncbi:hypothetical protein PV797_06810 [Clostridiaceae bacterium M8S5]|nr:hypothetical protein PV797_13370 [Clostridiaceae bacterium M8S5]WDV47379.1 hypothetical protein PV797_06810 [Clostridiaceae bacterium M8S5]
MRKRKKEAILLIAVLIMSVFNGTVVNANPAFVIPVAAETLKILGALLVAAGVQFTTKESCERLSQQLYDEMLKACNWSAEKVKNMLNVGANGVANVSKEAWNFTKGKVSEWLKAGKVTCSRAWDHLLNKFFYEKEVTAGISLSVCNRAIGFKQFSGDRRYKMCLDGVIIEKGINVGSFVHNGHKFVVEVNPYSTMDFVIEKCIGFAYFTFRKEFDGKMINLTALQLKLNDGTTRNLPFVLYEHVGNRYNRIDVALYPTNYVLENGGSVPITGEYVPNGSWDGDANEDGTIAVPIPTTWNKLVDIGSTDIGNIPTTPPTPPSGNVNIEPVGLRDAFENRMGLNIFKKAWDRLKNINTSKGKAPVIKVDLHSMFDAVSHIGNINNPFKRDPYILLDFGVFDKWQYLGISIIDYFRKIIGYGMIIKTFLYCWGKMIPSKVVE